MVRIGSALLGLVAATTLVWSCVQSDNLDNDEGAVKSQRDAGMTKRDAKAPSSSDDDEDDEPAPGDDDTGNDDEPEPGDDDTGDGEPEPGDDDEEPVPGDDDEPDASTGGKSDASTSKDDAGTGTMTSNITGSATRAKCSSYGEPSGGMCAGYFCGVTEADIAAALESKPSTVCPAATGESVCSGDLTTYVGDCARTEKLRNLLLSDEELRPKVQECVYKKDEALRKDTPPACISCFLDAAQCASANCLDACIGGNNAPCDACRQEHNCNEPVMKCAELPSPF